MFKLPPIWLLSHTMNIFDLILYNSSNNSEPSQFSQKLRIHRRNIRCAVTHVEIQWEVSSSLYCIAGPRDLVPHKLISCALRKHIVPEEPDFDIPDQYALWICCLNQHKLDEVVFQTWYFLRSTYQRALYRSAVRPVARYDSDGWSTNKGNECLVSNIIERKLKPFSKDVVGEHWGGFQRGKSAIDQILTVKYILDECWNK